MNDTTSPPAGGPSGSEQDRRHQRFRYHTAVTVVTDGPEGFVAVRARSDDISAGGAKIVCDERITSQRVYLRILIPELADTFVEAEVVNSRNETVTRLGTDGGERFTYNTRFQKFVSDRAMLDVLRVAAGLPATA